MNIFKLVSLVNETELKQPLFTQNLENVEES